MLLLDKSIQWQYFFIMAICFRDKNHWMKFGEQNFSLGIHLSSKYLNFPSMT